MVTHWIVPSVEYNLTTSVWIARVTIAESRMAAIPPTIRAINAFRTGADSFVSVSRGLTAVSLVGLVLRLRVFFIS